MAKKAGLALSAVTAAFNGSVVKKSLLAIAAKTAALNGSVSKKTATILTAASHALSGAVAETKAFVVNLTASMTAFSGSIAKRTAAFMSAKMSALFGAVGKQTRISLTSTMLSLSAAIEETGGGGTIFERALNATAKALFASLVSVLFHPTVEPWLQSLPFSQAMDIVGDENYPLTYRVGAASCLKGIMQKAVNRNGGSMNGVEWMFHLVNQRIAEDPEFALIYNLAPITYNVTPQS